MFDPRIAFQPLVGKEFNRGQLYRAIGKVRAANMKDLSPDVTLEDLVQLAAEKSWIHRRGEENVYTVVITP